MHGKGSFRDAGDLLYGDRSFILNRAEARFRRRALHRRLATWRMTGGEPGAGEKHMASLLNIKRRWSDEERLYPYIPPRPADSELLVKNGRRLCRTAFLWRTMVGTAVFRGVRRRYLAALTEREHPAPPAL